MIQRDYIDRLIQECAEALRRMLRLRSEGQHDEALQAFGQAVDRILGPIRPLVERMEPDSAVDFVGPNQLDRLRLYAAVSLSGGALVDDDLERIGVLTTLVDIGALGPRYRDELGRLARPQG